MKDFFNEFRLFHYVGVFMHRKKSTHLFETSHFSQQHHIDMYKPGVLTRPCLHPVPRSIKIVLITRILQTVYIHFQPPGEGPITPTSTANPFTDVPLQMTGAGRPRAGTARPCPRVGMTPGPFRPPVQLPLLGGISWWSPSPLGYHSWFLKGPSQAVRHMGWWFDGVTLSLILLKLQMSMDLLRFVASSS